jgi:hypothetical protein
VRDDGSDEEFAVPAQLDLRPAGRNPTSDLDSGMFVATCGQSGGLASRVDAAHLH